MLWKGVTLGHTGENNIALCRSELAREEPEGAAFIPNERGALEFFASKLAPTERLFAAAGLQRQSKVTEVGFLALRHQRYATGYKRRLQANAPCHYLAARPAPASGLGGRGGWSAAVAPGWCRR